MPVWSSTESPAMAGPSRFVDVRDGLLHTLAEEALLVTVAQLERLVLTVDAPLGTAARPRLPLAVSTSASTVGFPRESRISRAVTEMISGMVGALSRTAPRRERRPALALGGAGGRISSGNAGEIVRPRPRRDARAPVAHAARGRVLLD
jgi:hypothetical protein